jgi:hypothetical protein
MSAAITTSLDLGLFDVLTKSEQPITMADLAKQTNADQSLIGTDRMSRSSVASLGRVNCSQTFKASCLHPRCDRNWLRNIRCRKLSLLHQPALAAGSSCSYAILKLVVRLGIQTDLPYVFPRIGMTKQAFPPVTCMAFSKRQNTRP